MFPHAVLKYVHPNSARKLRNLGTKPSRIDELIETRQYLTITLSVPPTDSIANLLIGLEGVRTIEISPIGDNRLLIHFEAVHPDQLQIRVMEALTRAGISIIHFSRGRNLADRMVDLVNRPN